MTDKVRKQYEKDCEEHAYGMKHDPYYRHCYGGGNVPVPCCEYCTEFDSTRQACMKEWNNADPAYYVPDRDDQDPANCCDDYDWNGEWEED